MLLENNKIVDVVGVAETGKTILAIDRAMKGSDRGEKVIAIICGSKITSYWKECLKEFRSITIVNYNELSDEDFIKEWDTVIIDEA